MNRSTSRLNRAVLVVGIVCLLTSFTGMIFVAARNDNTPVAAQIPDTATRARIAERFGKLPLSFEINKGQTDERVKFLSHGRGYDLFLTSTDAVLTLHKPNPDALEKLKKSDTSTGPEIHEGSVLRLKMIGANTTPIVEGHDELPGKVNYFTGNNPAKWRREIPTYRKVYYKDVYPGIDIVYYGNQGELEYDFVVAPGANPKVIKFKVEGADRIRLDETGNLLFALTHGEVRLNKPLIYQLTAEGERRDVKGTYVINANEISFKVRAFDAKKALIIDPILSYSTFLGAGSNEHALGIAVDSQGNAYVTGVTSSSNFPTTPGAFKTTNTFASSAFVTKLNATGTNLVYSTYLSGTNFGITTGTSIAVDSAGNAHVAGSTSQTDFPIVNGLKTTGNFFKSTNSAANWSNINTGITGDVSRIAVAPNAPNIIYAGGPSGPHRSTDGGATWTKTPTTGLPAFPFPLSLAVDPNNSQVLYAGFINGGLHKTSDGGNTWSTITTIPLNFAGVSAIVFHPVTPTTIYVGSGAGVFRSTDSGATWTALNNFPTAFVPNIRALAIDPATPSTIYVGTFNNGLFKSTNSGTNWTAMNNGMGGNNPNSVGAIAIDPLNPSTIYTGHGSQSFSGSINKSINGGDTWNLVHNVPNFEVTALVIDRTNTSTVYAGTTGGGVIKTTNGGTNWANANAGLWSSNVRTLVSHPTDSATLFAGTNTEQSFQEAFVTKLNSAGSGLLFSTYLGGSLSDFGSGIALDGSGNIHVVGQTTSINFPAVNAIQSSPDPADTCGNGFVTKINPAVPAFVFSTYLGGTGCDGANAVTTDSSGNIYVTGSTSSSNFPLANAFQGTLGETFNGDAFVTKLTSAGVLSYSTFLGGNGSDSGRGIAVDVSGNAYVTGSTTSTNFPTANPIQATNGGSSGDVFVTKLNPQGSALVYSTYLGGSNIDIGRGIAVDATGNAFVTGFTGSQEFPLVAGSLRTRSALFKSFNGGASWSNDNYGLATSSILSLAVHPTQPATLYAGTSAGIFKSTNGGRNWTPINNGLNSKFIVEIIIDPSTPSTVYAAANEFANPNNGVYKSTDGGNTWNLRKTGMTFSNVESLAINPANPATLYAGTFGTRVFKTIDGADNWELTGATSPTAVFSLAVDPLTPTTVFAAEQFSNGGIFRSTNEGKDWEKLQTGEHATFVNVSPLTPGLVFAVTNQGFIKSTNGGNNWSFVRGGFGKVVFDPVNASTLYFLSSQGGVDKSTNSGQTWVPMNNGLPTPSAADLAIDPLKPSTLHVTSGSTISDDAFVTKINSAGSALIYSTLIGGPHPPGDGSSLNATAFAIAIDSTGNAYITGLARAGAFPTTPNAFQPLNRGSDDAFISKLTMSHIISGHVLEGGTTPLSGAEVVLNDGGSLTTFFTESDGSYEFSRLREGGSFTVIATKPHFTMAPPSQTFNNLTSDQVLNFTATATNAPFFTISGQVTENGTGIAGVLVTLSGSQVGTRTTDSNGNYSFELAGGGNYTVTTSLTGFTFTPPSQTFNSLSANQTANFTSNRQNLVVTNTNNHGEGSLREAIINANAIVGLDTIVFNIPGAGAKIINPQTNLPEITDPVVLDATTQPGYAGSPVVALDGTGIGGSTSTGLIISASGSTVRGLAIGRFDNAGIVLRDCTNNVIQGNYVGVDVAGNAWRNNSGIILSNASNNSIGGTTAAARNVVSGNQFHGISIFGSNNVIQGNFIGTNPAGTAAIPNGINGVEVAAANNLIGGTAPGAGNLISGNQRGIAINPSGVTVQGNLIGTDVTGTKKVPNLTGIETRAPNNLIGGLTPGARNVISGNEGDGITIGGNGSKLQGNFIGTDITGTLPLGNGSSGVVAGNEALIGGTVPEARNIISGNGVIGGFGNISIGSNSSGSGVTVQGNYIGTDVTGTRAIAESLSGIHISSENNVIGGLAPGAGNVISGNRIGIQIGGSITVTIQGTVIQGNLIGLNATGTGQVPNTLRGISLTDASNNTIGGTQNGAANKIAFNGGAGVLISLGTGNAVRGNSIFSNSGVGIDLGTNVFPAGPNGVTPNDPNDVDTGANNLQNFPVITSVMTIGGNTTIQGSLNSTPNTAFQIDFYSNAALDPSGNGEGAQFFNTTSVNTDGSGNATINVTFPVALGSGRIITATATDPNGNTSEFSAGDATGATGNLQFTASSLQVIEDVGLATITVVRQGGSSGTLTVDFATADGTAIAGQDYTTTSGTLTFNGGETVKTFQIPITDDAPTEVDETFTVTLRNTPGLDSLGVPNVLTVTIQDRTVVPSLSVPSVSVIEGGPGTTSELLVTVNLSAATGRSVSVNFATSNQTAFGGASCSTRGVDYETKSGTFTVQPGTTSLTIPVKVCGDTNAEANENVLITLSNPVNATIPFNQAFGTIINDDALELILEESGPEPTQAAALDALLLVRDPFRIVSIPEFWPTGPDKNTRIILFARNLELNPGEPPSAVIVRILGNPGFFFDVQAESVQPIHNFEFTEVVIRLPNTLPVGTRSLTIRAHGRVSNSGTIRIMQ